MNLTELIQRLLDDTVQVSLPGFLPELVLTATIVLMLLARMPAWGWKVHAFYVALPGVLIALFLAAPWRNLGSAPDAIVGREIFDGLLRYDTFTVYFRSLLLLFTVLFLVFTKLSGIPDREDSPDFYTLILGGIVGMSLMASANHLLIVFLAVEMASVPSYALAGMLKGRRQSSEAALKYSVYGAGTAGVMLYGISLLAGALGTVHMPTMASELASLTAQEFADRQTVLMMGGLMLMVGLAFKLSAVPFHFWCPDVFEGASAEVNAFLSVASKAAALALLLRVALGLSHIPGSAGTDPSLALRVSVSSSSVSRSTVHGPRSTLPASRSTVHGPRSTLSAPLDAARRYAAGLIAFLAAITCTFGNLTAYAQTNIKRLLAYSTIAHAGYMMMPVAAAVALSGDNPDAARDAVAAVTLYLGMYLFINLGAFAIVAFLRNAIRSEEIADYAGLIRRSPGVVICFSVILVSLIGLPPMNGFWAKALAFYALVPAEMYWLLAVGAINTVVSLFYYLRVIKVMAMDAEPADRVGGTLSMVSPAGIYIALVTVPVILLGIFWDPVNDWAHAAARQLIS